MTAHCSPLCICGYNPVARGFHMKTKLLGLMALLALLGSTAAANASPYVVMLEEVGANVVASGSGVLDLTGLSAPGGFFGYPGIGAGAAVIELGPVCDTCEWFDYTGISGPANFGSGTGFNASSGIGDFVGVFGAEGVLVTPVDYSGALLTSTDTFSGSSYASLGVTPGTYVWTWGPGADQNFTLDIIAPSVCSNVTCELHSTPLPSTWLMLLSGFVGLGFFAYRGTKKNVVVIGAA